MRFLSSSHFTWRRKLFLAGLLILLCAGLLVCWRMGRQWEQRRAAMPASPFPVTTEEYEQKFPHLLINHRDTQTESTNAKVIDLNSSGNSQVITEPGDYRLTGTMKGRVTVRTEDGNVHLMLDGVNISSPEGPAIYVESAGKTVITVMPGTDNVLSDSGNYAVGAEYEACVYSTCDLTINGTGSLTVNGYYKDAIRSRDVVKILDTHLTIKCKRTGIHGTDGIHVAGGRVMISSEKNGFKTTKNAKNGKGVMMFSGGEHSVVAGRYAFVCLRNDLYVFGCTIRAKSVVATYDVGGQKIIQEGCIR